MRAFPTTITLLRPARMAGYSIYNPVEPIIKKGSAWAEFLLAAKEPTTCYQLPATCYLPRLATKHPPPQGLRKGSLAGRRTQIQPSLDERDGLRDVRRASPCKLRKGMTIQSQ